jgi:hypothetical protein
MVDNAINLGNCLLLLMDSIKSSNLPPSTMLNSLLTIPSDFFSQQALCFAGCCQEVIYHSYPGSPKAYKQSKNVFYDDCGFPDETNDYDNCLHNIDGGVIL